MIRVGINGYGTVGKRIADAIALQDDMELVGVTKRTPNYWARTALKKGYALYAISDADAFRKAGYHIAGTLDDLLSRVDVIIDCSAEQGEENRSLYDAHNVKVIYQGGEDHALAGFSFVAQCNYDDAKGRDAVRVVSCNTTAMCRTLHSLDKGFGVEKVENVLIRRSADPHDSKKGPLNAIVPVLKTPTHHGLDAQTVLPHISAHTMAVAVPTTLMHLHSMCVTLSKNASRDEVIATFKDNPRLLLISGNEGFRSTAEIMEYAKELEGHRQDLHQIAIWEDSISVTDRVVRFYQAVHQEADIVPENVDAVRAMFGTVSKEESMKKTDASLKIC